MAETLKIHEKKILKLNILLSEARQAKTEHMEMKILQPIFGILDVLTKNEFTKICNEPSKSLSFFQLRKTHRRKNLMNSLFDKIFQ